MSIMRSVTRSRAVLVRRPACADLTPLFIPRLRTLADMRSDLRPAGGASPGASACFRIGWVRAKWLVWVTCYLLGLAAGLAVAHAIRSSASPGPVHDPATPIVTIRELKK